MKLTAGHRKLRREMGEGPRIEELWASWTPTFQNGAARAGKEMVCSSPMWGRTTAGHAPGTKPGLPEPFPGDLVSCTSLEPVGVLTSPVITPSLSPRVNQGHLSISSQQQVLRPPFPQSWSASWGTSGRHSRSSNYVQGGVRRAT